MHARLAFAMYEWAAGLLVGLTPLLCHFTINAGSSAARGGNWTVDLLFVAITTSGLSTVKVVARLARGALHPRHITPHGLFLIILNIVAFLLAGVLFGRVSTDPALAHDLLMPLLFLALAIASSLYFEITLARTLIVADHYGISSTKG